MRVSSWAVCATLSLPSTTVTGFTSNPRVGGVVLAYTTRTSSSASASKPFGASSALRMAWGDDKSYDSNYSNDGNRSNRSSPSPYANPDGHDYKRDTSSDTSNVDVDAVNGLLGERLRARKKGDFDIADKIRDQLTADHKVTVFDKDKLWATGYNGGQQGFNRGGTRGDRGGRGGRGGMQRRDRDFGPNGHDYAPCAEAGPISSTMSEPEIHSKVAERLIAKMRRDWETADRVQFELVDAGVFINDKTKEWRADGVNFIDPSEGRRPQSDRNRPYVQSKHSQTLPENAQYEQISQLVLQRTEHKQDKNFIEADYIRESLVKDFNIVIDDRVREWSVGGSFGKDADLKRAHSEAVQSRDYVKSSASLELPDGVTSEEVQIRINARTKAKMNRQYQESDAMRDEILKDFGIVIHDTIKMWSVGGDFGMDDPVKARAKAAGTFTRRGGGHLSEDDVLLIQAMITKRFEAKRVRNFVVADEIRAHLHTTYNINIDDKSREWRVLSDDYVQTEAESGARTLTVEELSTVESKILKRARLKKDRCYEEADAIRDMLLQNYSIVLDDRAKEWKIVSSGGHGGGNSKFIEDAARSQSSPYKQKQMDQEFDEEFDSIFLEDEMKDELDLQESPSSVNVVVNAPEEKITLAPSALSRDELMSLTVPLLKDKLRESGKPVSGKKAELIDRLLA
eukprot:scaffold197_cov268-Chaetoceros_neogracile.AAC.38